MTLEERIQFLELKIKCLELELSVKEKRIEYVPIYPQYPIYPQPNDWPNNPYPITYCWGNGSNVKDVPCGLVQNTILFSVAN